MERYSMEAGSSVKQFKENKQMFDYVEQLANLWGTVSDLEYLR